MCLLRSFTVSTANDKCGRGGEISVGGEKEIDDLRLRYGRTNYGRVVTAVIETITFN